MYHADRRSRDDARSVCIKWARLPVTGRTRGVAGVNSQNKPVCAVAVRWVVITCKLAVHREGGSRTTQHTHIVVAYHTYQTHVAPASTVQRRSTTAVIDGGQRRRIKFGLTPSPPPEIFFTLLYFTLQPLSGNNRRTAHICCLQRGIVRFFTSSSFAFRVASVVVRRPSRSGDEDTM